MGGEGGRARSVAASAVAASFVVVGIDVGLTDGSPAAVGIGSLDALLHLAFVWAGTLAMLWRPGNRLGPVMLATGPLAALSNLAFVEDAPLLHTIGLVCVALFALPVGYVVLAYPAGRLRRGERALLGAMGVHLTFEWALVLTTYEPRAHECPDCPAGSNLLLLWRSDGLYDVLAALHSAVSVGFAVVIVLLLARRRRRSTRAMRSVLSPMLWSGVFAAGVTAATAPFAYEMVRDSSTAVALHALWAVGFGALPAGVLAGLTREAMRRATAGRLLETISEPRPAHVLTRRLRDVLDDPSVALGFLDPVAGTYHDADGEPIVRFDAKAKRALDPADPPRALLLHDDALLHDPELLAAVTRSAAAALANAWLVEEVAERLAEAQAARARLVEAGDDARRGIERDLHDGVQQTLVSLRLALRMLADATQPGTSADGLVETARELAARAGDELRELAHGVYPAVLTAEGLPGALRELARSGTQAVDARVVLDARPPAVVEAAVLFFCREAVANAGKHAPGARVFIAVGHDGAVLVATAADDGPGGACRTRGTGLRGLEDRLGALGGTVDVFSPEGAGTRLVARVPCVLGDPMAPPGDVPQPLVSSR